MAAFAGAGLRYEAGILIPDGCGLLTRKPL